jgi:adenine-specific DNA-methyltransferase
MTPTDAPDFSLQPFQERMRPAEPTMLVPASDLDTPYADEPVDELAAEPTPGAPRRRKRNTARLVWDSKPKKAPNPRNLGFQIAEVVVPNPASQSGPRLPFDPGTQEVDTTACNRLIWGDNLLVMQALLAQGYEGKINLIYIDPPFDSKADYSHSVQLTPDETGKGGGELNAEMSALERLAYRDTWEDGTDSYLDMIVPRLQAINRLLANNGSIYIHCDTRLIAQFKILMDEIFGRKQFKNWLIWNYETSGYPQKQWAEKSDHILMYTKSENWVFNLDAVREPYEPDSFERNYPHVDEDGKRYRNKNGRRYYAKEGGKHPDDVWFFNHVYSEDPEKTDYQTQKPEKLIENIIKASSNAGDLVADFFCGSGTTAAVAEKLGRRWITSDLGKASIQVARNRFVKLGEPGSGGIAFQRPDGATRCAPFVVENLGNYQRQLLYLHDTRLKQVGSLILTLYGAQAHPTERSLGVQGYNEPETGRFQRRLVLVGDPDRPLSAKRVAEAARSLKSLDGGGYSRLVALGWDFELNFDSSLEKHLGPDWRKVVELRQIPTEVIEYLKKIPAEAGPDDPAVEKLRGQVAFFEKPYLAPPELRILGWTGEAEPRLRVALTLTRYLLRGLPMGLQGKRLNEDEARALIQRAGGASGLNLIDFWSVDDFFGGDDGKRPFTSTWQALRGLGKRVRPVETTTELIYAPQPGRRAALRLVDLFGNDALWTGLLPDTEDARRAGF